MIFCAKSRLFDDYRHSKEVLSGRYSYNYAMLTRLALIVTTRCDYHCAHCARGLSDQRVDFPLELLPTLLEQARPFGARHVGFIGGEPHLHPQFAELVEMVSQAGYTWHFVSHGESNQVGFSWGGLPL